MNANVEMQCKENLQISSGISGAATQNDQAVGWRHRRIQQVGRLAC